MTKALSKAENVDEDTLAYKLMGNWNPNAITFQELILDEKNSDYLSKPYPFYLAYSIEGDVSGLGNPEEWSVEHKWDGIRSQTIIRENEIFVWSRGEELVTDKYPEFHSFLGNIPDGTVIDAEILAFNAETVEPHVGDAIFVSGIDGVFIVHSAPYPESTGRLVTGSLNVY